MAQAIMSRALAEMAAGAAVTGVVKCSVASISA